MLDVRFQNATSRKLSRASAASFPGSCGERVLRLLKSLKMRLGLHIVMCVGDHMNT